MPDEAARMEAGDAAHPVERAVESVAGAARTVADAVAEPLPLPELGGAGLGEGEGATIRLLDDVLLDVKIELGRSRMFVEDLLHLKAESVIELDKAAGDPVDIFVNDRHVARGEVLVVNENFCVRISEIIRNPGEE